MKSIIIIVFTVVLSFFIPHTFAQLSSLENEEMLVITKSEAIADVIFDGKWTTVTEWKQSTLSKFEYEDTRQVNFKSAHSGDYIYMLIDFENDYTLDNMSDKATICFDSKNNKSDLPDNDDYCFSLALGQKQGNIFRGGNSFPLNSHMEKIENEKYISISTKSDDIDRFSKIPHPVYEFKIPIELLGRSDNYGFFISVYEASSDTYYNWPMKVHREGLEIPSPNQWGEIISPDKSLPEFNIPLLIMLTSVLSIVFLGRKVSFFKIS